LPDSPASAVGNSLTVQRYFAGRNPDIHSWGLCCIAAKMRLLRNGSAGFAASISIPLSFRGSL
jgi:hypothetical protein